MDKRDGVFYLGKKDMAGHIHRVGTTGKGKSSLIAEMASQRGISYAEMEEQMAPTPEELERRRLEGEQVRAERARRIRVVASAYWDAVGSDKLSEFAELTDAYREHLGSTPSPEDLKCIFLDLPANIIGPGIEHGFDDTEVRDAVYSYVRDNAERLKARGD